MQEVLNEVAPVGAWIEIRQGENEFHEPLEVAPVGAWIEILYSSIACIAFWEVAPVGAWIEISPVRPCSSQAPRSRPCWGVD